MWSIGVAWVGRRITARRGHTRAAPTRSRHNTELAGRCNVRSPWASTEGHGVFVCVALSVPAGVDRERAIMKVTSPRNPRITAIRLLRQRKERERAGLFFAEGARAVVEAVQLGLEVELLVVVPELLASERARQAVAGRQRLGTPRLDVSAEVFESLAPRYAHQGMGVVLRQRWRDLPATPPAGALGWVALDTVQDPGNLGTILRTCDATGVTGVILLGPATDPYDPAAVRASAGAVFSQRLVRASLADFIAWKRRHDWPVVGATGDAARDYRGASYQTPLILAMGSERAGLSAELRAVCDQVVSIPMAGRCDSLNLAVATGVMLYEILRQARAG